MGLTLRDPTGLKPMEKKFLTSYDPQGTGRVKRPRSSVFLWGSPLANYHGYSLRDSLLIKQASKGWWLFFPEALKAGRCLQSLSAMPQSTSISWRGALIIQLWWPGLAFIPESHGTMAVRKMVHGRLPPPGHCAENRMGNTPQSFCEGGLFLSWSFSLRGRLQVWHTSSGLWSSSQGMCAADAVLALSLCLAPACWYLPQKSWYAHLEF